MIYEIYQFETPLTYLVQIFCQETWPILIAYLEQMQRGEFRFNLSPRQGKQHNICFKWLISHQNLLELIHASPIIT